MTWSQQQRYQRIEEVSSGYLEQIAASTLADEFLPQYHIAPSHGLLNDPNGLCFYNGEHHIFYQWFPLGPVHGLKYWYHVSTKDFVSYTDHGIALSPDSDYDSHGCYSGGALVDGEQALLFFTGNQRDENWVRVPTQCYAIMDKQGQIEKHGVIIENSVYTEHFRDPKVWKDSEDGRYYMVLGVQTQELKGQMALYSAETIGQSDAWRHHGVIQTQYTDLGHMWECPDLFELDGKTIMLFSPQGVKSIDKYSFKNIYSVTYLVGERLDKQQPALVNHQPCVELDSGHDFYAPQTYVDDKGRRILIGWVGLPDIAYPTDKNMWAHMLTLPRLLTVDGNSLIQSPLPELKALRQSEHDISGVTPLSSRAFELCIQTAAENFELVLANRHGENARFSMSAQEFVLDRGQMTHPFAEEFGHQRFVKRTDKQQNIRLFFDHSVLEVFVNKGKSTLTSRIFIEDLCELRMSDGLQGTLYYLAADQD